MSEYFIVKNMHNKFCVCKYVTVTSASSRTICECDTEDDAKGILEAINTQNRIKRLKFEIMQSAEMGYFYDIERGAVNKITMYSRPELFTRAEKIIGLLS